MIDPEVLQQEFIIKFTSISIPSEPGHTCGHTQKVFLDVPTGASRIFEFPILGWSGNSVLWKACRIAGEPYAFASGTYHRMDEEP